MRHRTGRGEVFVAAHEVHEHGMDGVVDVAGTFDVAPPLLAFEAERAVEQRPDGRPETGIDV